MVGMYLSIRDAAQGCRAGEYRTVIKPQMRCKEELIVTIELHKPAFLEHRLEQRLLLVQGLVYSV
jgi:hypothetical protein